MPSTVYFWNLRASIKAPYEQRMKKLLKSSKINDGLDTGHMVAVKIHFGEHGTTGFLRPVWVKPVISFLKKTGALPFLTDTSTLYVGQRGEAVSHHLQAERHGFTSVVTGAPVIIADGIRGKNQVEIPVDGKQIKSAHIAGDIADAESIVTLSHVKGHELAGFGGTLKNLGMGCASKQGKMHQHMTTGPTINRDKCKGCGSCVKLCAAQALTLDEENLIVLNEELCVGCGGCFLACRHHGLAIDWKTNVQTFLEKMMEYALAVVKTKTGPCLYINYVVDVVPDCDCVGFTDAPICPDLGVLVSTDPVAVDQAAIDLVSQAEALQTSALPNETKKGDNKFLAIHEHVPEDMGLQHAETIGLGSRKYKLIQI